MAARRGRGRPRKLTEAQVSRLRLELGLDVLGVGSYVTPILGGWNAGTEALPLDERSFDARSVDARRFPAGPYLLIEDVRRRPSLLRFEDARRHSVQHTMGSHDVWRHELVEVVNCYRSDGYWWIGLAAPLRMDWPRHSSLLWSTRPVPALCTPQLSAADVASAARVHLRRIVDRTTAWRRVLRQT